MLLLGRDSELTGCLAAFNGQSPTGLVITGEPGIGKTTLFRAALNAAAKTEHRVLVTTGISGEAGVPLTNLADLFDPLAGEVLCQLPSPQADALRSALNLTGPAARVD